METTSTTSKKRMPSQLMKPSQLRRPIPCDRASIDVLDHILGTLVPRLNPTDLCTKSQTHLKGLLSVLLTNYHDLCHCCLDISHPEHAILHTLHHPLPLTLGIHPFLLFCSRIKRSGTATVLPPGELQSGNYRIPKFLFTICQ